MTKGSDSKSVQADKTIPEGILENPKEKIIKDLHSYLAQIKLELNIDSYTYIYDAQNFISGITLYVRVLGISKPVHIDFSELGFTETRITKETADKIFKS